MKIGALRLLGRLIKGRTPAVGRKIRSFGAKLLGGAAVTGGASITLPEAPDSTVEMLRLILEVLTVIQAIVGTIMMGAGQVQTDEDVEN